MVNECSTGRAAVLMAFLTMPSGPALAQQDCSRAVLPVSVTLPDGRILRSLEQKHFVARGRPPAEIIRVAAEKGPRRIVLVLDTGAKTTSDVWLAQLTAASLLVSSGRAEDRFALVTFGHSHEAFGFDVSREALSAKLAEYEKARPAGSATRTTVFEGIDRALAHFGPSQFGDAIIIFLTGAMPEEGRRIGAIRTAAQKSLTRLYGLWFGTMSEGWFGASDGQAMVQPNEFTDLFVATGGEMRVGSTGNPQKVYKFEKAQRERLTAQMQRFYGKIAEPYAVELNVGRNEKPIQWQIEVTPDLQKRFASLEIGYPAKVPACP